VTEFEGLESAIYKIVEGYEKLWKYGAMIFFCQKYGVGPSFDKFM
jgi:hypothetical protein